MIEINLVEEKKKFKAPTVAGMDLSQINLKMVIIAILINQTPDWFLKDHFANDIKQVKEEVNKLDAEARNLSKDLKGNENIKQKLAAFNRQIQKLKQRSTQVDKIIKEKTNPKKLLEKIARSTPDDLWFDELKITQQRDVVIKGGASSYKSIGNFITAANESLFFGRSLTLGDSKTVTEEKFGKKIRVETFEIKGKIQVFDPYQNR